MSEGNIRSKHSCEALVRGCIDFRVWKPLVQYVDETFHFTDYDVSCEPGGVKNILDEAERGAGIKGIKISCRLHSMRVIVLSAHEDCGAYGGSKNFFDAKAEREFHIEQLKQAKEIIRQVLQSSPDGCFDEKGNYVEKEFILLYVYFSEDGSAVEVEQVG